MSTYDMEQVLIRAGEDSVDGIDSLPVDLEEVVTKTFETRKIVEPPERRIESPKKPKKVKAKKQKEMAQSRWKILQLQLLSLKLRSRERRSVL